MILILDMYVIPLDDQLSQSPPNSASDRPLPELPPPELSPKMSNDEFSLAIQAKNFKIPENLSELTVDKVSQVLRYLNMNEHVHEFKKNLVDGELLKSLDDNTFGALGVDDPLQQLKLKKVIKGWRPKN